MKRFVAPLRESERVEELCQMRFETGPGEQSQIDWGQLGTHFRAQPVTLHLFVLTLGFSRQGFYCACVDEQLSQFLEAHERAFEHFGGLTREHLYDRPRTVCYPDDEGRRVWNPTFKAFSEYWGFEPRLCRAYRAQTKGKVESGVKYVKRNFAPGRSFVDIVDFQAQLDEWNACELLRFASTLLGRYLWSVPQNRHHNRSPATPCFCHDRRLAKRFPIAGGATGA